MKDPLNNIDCGVAIVLDLIEKHGKITFIKGRDPGMFFETLLFDAAYLTVDRILADVWAFAV